MEKTGQKPTRISVGDVVEFRVGPEIKGVCIGILLTGQGPMYDIAYFDNNGERSVSSVSECELE